MAAALKLERKQYTYADYLTWDDNIRREIIDGEVRNMAAPTVRHQDAAGEIYVQMSNFLKGKNCKPYISPIDVRLTPDKIFKKDKNVVQPDVIVLCDSGKISEDGKSIVGAPDLVAEVLSPGSAENDRFRKFMKYQETGVREYWVVDLDAQSVDSFNFECDPHLHRVYSFRHPVPVRIIEGLTIDLSDFYDSDPEDDDF